MVLLYCMCMCLSVSMWIMRIPVSLTTWPSLQASIFDVGFRAQISILPTKLASPVYCLYNTLERDWINPREGSALILDKGGYGWALGRKVMKRKKGKIKQIGGRDSKNSIALQMRFTAWLCHRLSVWPWSVTELLCCGFLICRGRDSVQLKKCLRGIMKDIAPFHLTGMIHPWIFSAFTLHGYLLTVLQDSFQPWSLQRSQIIQDI